MRIVLYLILCFPFWSVALGLPPEQAHQASHTIEEAEQIDDTFEYDDVQSELLKEYSYTRRRRVVFGPSIYIPENTFIRINWAPECRQDRIYSYSNLQRVLTDVAHCHRMTPF